MKNTNGCVNKYCERKKVTMIVLMVSGWRKKMGIMQEEKQQKNSQQINSDCRWLFGQKSQQNQVLVFAIIAIFA